MAVQPCMEWIPIEKKKVSEESFPHYYVGESGRWVFEQVKDQNGRHFHISDIV